MTTKTTTVTIIWPDGSTSVGRGPVELAYYGALEAARKAQAHAYTREEFREELAKRAKVWTGREVPTSGGPRRFLRALESVGLFRIEEDR